MGRYVLAIDQGTTSSRACCLPRIIALRRSRRRSSRSISRLPAGSSTTPRRSGDDARDGARRRSPRPARARPTVAAIGITNQRETTVVWDRATGQPIHHAIVWQDRRTADVCQELDAARAAEPVVATRPGCCSTLISRRPRSPGSSTTLPARARRAERGELAFGTVDTFLLWRLTGGRVHATDATNASRTCCSTSTRANGTTSCCSSFACRARCCPRCATTPPSSARPSRRFSALPSRSAAWPATSRRRPSARPASRPA